jgi:hypothetical protein
MLEVTRAFMSSADHAMATDTMKCVLWALITANRNYSLVNGATTAG